MNFGGDDPWKSSKAVIEEIRKAKIPALLNGVQA